MSFFLPICLLRAPRPKRTVVSIFCRDHAAPPQPLLTAAPTAARTTLAFAFAFQRVRVVYQEEANRMASLESLDDLLQDELKDIYDAEKQITKALPKMAKKASSE